MTCALSDAAPLAVIGTEVLDSMVRGGLAAPNDVSSFLDVILIIVVRNSSSIGDEPCSASTPDCWPRSNLRSESL
jgi:hypothetical protein